MSVSDKQTDHTGGTEKKLKIENDNLNRQKFYDLLFGAFKNMVDSQD